MIDLTGLNPNCVHPFPTYCAYMRLNEIIEENASNGAEALVKVFTDNELNTVWSNFTGTTVRYRLEWLLSSVVEPSQTGYFGLLFGSECNFSQDLTDAQFYPAWGLPRNASYQVNHFLTAVSLRLHPKRYGSAIVADRLAIGHEKISDLAGFSAQFKSTTNNDVTLFHQALALEKQGDSVRRDRMLLQLLNEDVNADYVMENQVYCNFTDPTHKATTEDFLITANSVSVCRLGNSLNDFRLTIKGYAFADWVKENSQANPLQGGWWLRRNLGIWNER